MSDIITSEFVNKYKDKQPNWGFNGLGYIVYKRTYARLKDNGQTEEWYETVQRCVNGAQKIGAKYTKEEAEKLYDYIFNLKGNFAGRMLWQLGTSTVDRFGANSLLNCWYVSINSPEAFCFLFENLMLGGGVGYSVKREHIHDLPKVKNNVKISHLKTNDASFIVPDSREGWIELLRKVLESFFTTGKSFTYSTILIRGYGELIKGFGGTASGPGILIDGIDKICKIISDRSGKKLRSVDCLDICNIIGSIVVAGNVRRSAEIAIGDPDDVLYLRAKRWDLGNIPNYRAMSNNSIYVDSFDKIMPEIWDGYTGKGEPYGFINMKTSKIYGRLGEKRKDNCEGYNPSMPKGTLVGTKDGIFEIQDLQDKEFLVKSLDGNWAKAKCFLSGKDKDVYEICLGKHKYTHATKEHKWPVLRNGSIVKVTTDKLVEGDLIPLNRNEETGIVGDTSLSYDEGLLIGTILGDGWFSKRKNRDGYVVGVCFSKNERHRAEKILKIINSLKANPSTIKERSNELNIQVTDNDFCELLINKYKLPLSKEKDIPKSVWSSNDNYIKGFVDGIFSTDGCVEKDKSICLSSSRKSLIINMSKLLSFYGIPSSINDLSTNDAKFPNKKSYDKVYSRWTLKISIGSIKKFNNIFKLSEQSKQLKIDDSIAMSNSVAKRLSLKYATVKSVCIKSKEDVWDITVYHDQHVFPSQYCYTGNCAEIGLADYECCNLSEIYLNNVESKEELLEISKLLYKTQKAICALPFIHPETEKIVHKNMRIGLGVTGVCQSINKLEWLDEAYQSLREFDKTWSKENGWPESIKLTTIKPSGTLSLLAGATPGVHPAYDKYYLRRIRMSSGDKLVKACKDLGYHTEYLKGFDGVEDHATIVVTFPCHAGSEAIVAKNFSAIEQLELVKKMQTIWSDNSVSVTVYYKSEELDNIKQWLKDNLENSVKTVSFLLHSEHGFAQAPYQSITEDEYKEMIKHVKPLLSVIDDGVGSIDNQECSSGACPLK